MKRHVLKVWPSQWEATYLGRKLFEWRRDDRDYELADELVLLSWDPETKLYGGAGLICEVTYILRGRFDVPEGYCVMGIKIVGETTAEANGIAKRAVKR